MNNRKCYNMFIDLVKDNMQLSLIYIGKFSTTDPEEPSQEFLASKLPLNKILEDWTTLISYKSDDEKKELNKLKPGIEDGSIKIKYLYRLIECIGIEDSTNDIDELLVNDSPLDDVNQPAQDDLNNPENKCCTATINITFAGQPPFAYRIFSNSNPLPSKPSTFDELKTILNNSNKNPPWKNNDPAKFISIEIDNNLPFWKPLDDTTMCGGDDPDPPQNPKDEEDDEYTVPFNFTRCKGCGENDAESAQQSISILLKYAIPAMDKITLIKSIASEIIKKRKITIKSVTDFQDNTNRLTLVDSNPQGRWVSILEKDGPNAVNVNISIPELEYSFEISVLSPSVPFIRFNKDCCIPATIIRPPELIIAPSIQLKQTISKKLTIPDISIRYAKDANTGLYTGDLLNTLIQAIGALDLNTDNYNYDKGIMRFSKNDTQKIADSLDSWTKLQHKNQNSQKGFCLHCALQPFPLNLTNPEILPTAEQIKNEILKKQQASTPKRKSIQVHIPPRN